MVEETADHWINVRPLDDTLCLLGGERWSAKEIPGDVVEYRGAHFIGDDCRYQSGLAIDQGDRVILAGRSNTLGEVAKHPYKLTDAEIDDRDASPSETMHADVCFQKGFCPGHVLAAEDLSFQRNQTEIRREVCMDTE